MKRVRRRRWRYQKAEKQKTLLYQKYLYIYRGDYKIKNNEIVYSKDIDGIEKKLKSEIYQIFSSSYKRATRQAKK